MNSIPPGVAERSSSKAGQPVLRPWWLRYGSAVGIVAVACGLREAFTPVWGPTAVPFIFFFPALVLATWYGRLGPGVVALVLSTPVADWYFIEPRHSLLPKDPSNTVGLLVFAGTGYCIIWAIEAMHRANDRARNELDKRERLNAELERCVEERTSEIREKASRLAEAERVAKVGSWEWDVDRDRVTWSDELCRIFGLTPETFGRTYKGFLNRLPPEDRERVQGIVDHSRRTGESFDFYHPIVRPDGTARTLHSRGQVVLGPSARPVRMLGTAQDVTEEKQLEERGRQLSVERGRRVELEASQARQTFLADAGAILSSSLDYESTLSKVAELTTRRLSDWCSIYIVEESGEIRHVTVLHRDPEMTRKGQEIVRRYPFDPKHQEAITRVLATGRPELYPEIGDDALRAAAHDEEHYRLLKDVAMGCGFSLPLGVGERILGVLTLVWDAGRVYSEDDLALARAIADRAALALENARLYQQARAAVEEIRKLNEGLEGTVQERTRELRETIRELEAFSYTVAHDLRAPLRAMHGLADLIQEDAGERLGAREEEHLKGITRAADHMDALVRDLLAYSRLSRADMPAEPTDLNSLVTEVLQQMDAEIRSREAEVEVEGGMPQVLGNRVTLSQVLMNLLANAVKFVAMGVKPRIRIAAQTRPGWVRVIVEDNGIGIVPEHHERVFQVFQRLHRAEAYSGTGIGLAIVRRAIERMGGQVGVDSQEGQGSRFWFELPGVPSTTDAKPSLLSGGSGQSGEGG